MLAVLRVPQVPFGFSFCTRGSKFTASPACLATAPSASNHLFALPSPKRHHISSISPFPLLLVPAHGQGAFTFSGKTRTGYIVFKTFTNLNIHLKQFILRRQVITLYRDLNRTLRLIENTSERSELRNWIRDDFKSHMHLSDQSLIKLHLARGRKALKQLQVTLALPHCTPSGSGVNKNSKM